MHKFENMTVAKRPNCGVTKIKKLVDNNAKVEITREKQFC